MKLFKQKGSENLIVASVDGQQCRTHYFSQQTGTLTQESNANFKYKNLDDLEDQVISRCKENRGKNADLRWLLSHELYQTYHTDAPNVLEKEMAEAIKWQIKDQLELPIDDILINYYRPNHPDPENTQVVAICVEKKLIERLISIAEAAGLTLNSIEIEELTLGHALINHLPENKIVGYIGENKSGLVFSFYQNNQLVFSRFKKGRFMPKAQVEEFVLEADATNASHKTPQEEAEEDAFLLETQRTLDYVISQLFRKPIDLILLQQNSDNSARLAETVNQLVETQVKLVSSNIKRKPISNGDTIDTTGEIDSLPTLAEAGCALRRDP